MLMSDGCICIWVVDNRMAMRVYVSSIDSYYHIMRPNQRKQLQRQLEEEEESHSYIEEQSIRLHRTQQRHPASHPNHATSQRSNYPHPKKKDFWRILGDNKRQAVGLVGRQDYDSRRQQTQPAGQQDREERKWAKFGRTKQELDGQLNSYNQSSETATRKSQQSKGSRQLVNYQHIIPKEVMGNEEQDLSFTELQPSKTIKGQNIKEASHYQQQQQSSDWLQPVESEKKVQAKPVRKEEIRQERKVEAKPDRKQQQKVQCRQSKEPIINAVKPDRKENNQKQKQPVGTEQSGTSLNKAFNNISKDESSQSSCWLEEKILDHLLLQQLPESSRSGSNQSYISNIDYTLHPSEQSQSLSMQQEQRMEIVLLEIDSSMGLQQKDLLLSVVFERNIQEVIIKEVWVGRLGISVSLALVGENTIVKRSLVDGEKLRHYISFYHTRAIHSIDDPARQLRLCRLRVPQREDRKPESGFIKKRREGQEKQIEAQELARVVRVEVRCANCGKASEVPVIQSTREASLSCTNCGEQMIARIDSLGLQ